MKALILKPPTAGASRNVVRDFIYGCWCNGRRIGGMQMPPLNDLYVATHCRNQGIDALFIDAPFEPERFEAIRASRYDGIGAVLLLTSTQSFREDADFLRSVKEANPKTVTIMYGSHPTFVPEPCLADDAIDYIVLREPENTVAELLLALFQGRPVHDIQGIGYRDPEGKPTLTPARPFMDMDDLPIPDRGLLPQGVDYFNPVIKRAPYTTMQTSRGCPGKCIFCTAPEFYGRRIRARSPELVVEEILQLRQKGFREIFFRDETFTAYAARNAAICEALIRKGTDVTWIANARVDTVDGPGLHLMKRAGCHMLKFGVETASDELLATYQKGTSRAQTVQAFQLAKAAGLDTHAHLVFGGPGETPATIRETIDFIKQLAPTTASFGILTPYPGTKLFDMVRQKHPEIGDGTSSNMANLHVAGFYSEALCGMSGDELSRWIVKAYREFYLRPRYVLGKLAKIRSVEELFALSVAGSNILQFALSGRK